MLLYASLTLDALSACWDRTPRADMTEQMIGVATIMAAVLILLLVFRLVRARRARTGRAGADRGVGAVVDLPDAGDRRKGLQLDSFVDIVSCGLTLAGLYCSFSGDAKGWLTREGYDGVGRVAAR